MKKIVILLLLILTLALSACGSNQAETASTPYENGKVEATTESGITSDAAIETEASDCETTGAAAACAVVSARQPSASVKQEETRTSKKEMTCTFSIRCDTILANIDKLDPAKEAIVPEDGVIYAAREVSFQKGETVFDLLARITKENKIHMEYTKTPAFNTNYVEGIANLYEFDCGELSGWTYKVNGELLSYGSSNAEVAMGDVIEWVYTCDQGRDVGGLDYE